MRLCHESRLAAIALLVLAGCSGGGDAGPAGGDGDVVAADRDETGDGGVSDGDAGDSDDGAAGGDAGDGGAGGDQAPSDDDPQAVLPDRCNLQFPEIVSAGVQGASVTYYGRVEKLGLTDVGDAAATVLGELLVGPLGGDPAASPHSFAATPAAHNGAVSAQSYEELTADVVLGAAGEYSVFFRASVDGGVSWRVCDLDGFDAHGGASVLEPRAGGVLRVYATQDAPNLVDYCRVWQAEWTVSASGAPPVVTVELYEPGVTDGGAPDLVAELGLGPLGANPAQPGAFTWAAAAMPYKGEGPSAPQNDEHEAPLWESAPAPGAYQVVVRARRADSAASTFCDTMSETMDFLHDHTSRLTLSP